MKQKKDWCEHVGGHGPPFPFCEICAAKDQTDTVERGPVCPICGQLFDAFNDCNCCLPTPSPVVASAAERPASRREFYQGVSHGRDVIPTVERPSIEAQQLTIYRERVDNMGANMRELIAERDALQASADRWETMARAYRKGLEYIARGADDCEGDFNALKACMDRAKAALAFQYASTGDKSGT